MTGEYGKTPKQVAEGKFIAAWKRIEAEVLEPMAISMPESVTKNFQTAAILQKAQSMANLDENLQELRGVVDGSVRLMARPDRQQIFYESVTSMEAAFLEYKKATSFEERFTPRIGSKKKTRQKPVENPKTIEELKAEKAIITAQLLAAAGAIEDTLRGVPIKGKETKAHKTLKAIKEGTRRTPIDKYDLREIKELFPEPLRKRIGPLLELYKMEAQEYARLTNEIEIKQIQAKREKEGRER